MSSEHNSRPERSRGGERLQKPAKAPKKRPQLPRKQRILRRVYIALTVLSAVIVALFILYNILVVKPRAGAKPGTDVEEPLTTEDVTRAPDNVRDDSSERKEDFFTFLIVGRDTGGGGNTDTIMLAAYDVPNQKFSVMSIPRDTMVNIPYDIKRINAVYNYYGGGEKGIDALYKEVSQLVGFRPDYEIVVEWKAVGELVDAIDGVDFNVPMRMRYYDPTQNLNIDLQKGQQHMNGDKAMQLIRFRHNNDLSVGYADGDIGRIRTQQEFMKAAIKKCLSQITDLDTIKALAKVFTDNVQTDLKLGNLVWLAQKAVFGGLDMDNITFVTMPADYNGYAWSRVYENNQSYVLPKADELMGVVNEHFNPFTEDLTTENLDIMSVNRDGSLSSTTGVVEDSKAARAPVKPSKPSSSPSPEPEPSPSPEPTQSDAPDEGNGPAGSPGPGPGDVSSPSPSPSSSPGGRPAESPAPSPSPSPGGSFEITASPEPSQPPAVTAAPESPEPPESAQPPATLPPMPTPVETPAPGGPPEGIPIF